MLTLPDNYLDGFQQPYSLRALLQLRITFRRLAHKPAPDENINLIHCAQLNKLIPLKITLRAIILIALNFIYRNKARALCQTHDSS